jgi:outer membrane receptor protein involved in Fe transport
MKKFLLVLCTIFLFTLPHSAAAEDDIETFFIKGRFQEMDTRTTSQQVTAILVEETDADASDTAADLLKRVPGVDVKTTGGAMQSSTVSLRGANSEQVLVLIDGRRLNSAQGGGVDLSAVPLYNVERIEIIRGGANAKYGENAMGGVINIVTKKIVHNEPDWGADYSFGSWNTHRGSVHLQGGIPLFQLQQNPITADAVPYIERALDYSVGLFGLFTDGNYTYERQLSEDLLKRVNAGGYRGGGSLSVGYDFSRSKAVRAELSASGYYDQKGIPGSVEFPSENAWMSDRRLSGALQLSYKNNRFAAVTVDGSLGYTERIFDTGIQTEGTADISCHQNVASVLSVNLERRDDFNTVVHQLETGYELRLDYLHSTALADNDGLTESGEITRTLPCPEMISADPGTSESRFLLIPGEILSSKETLLQLIGFPLLMTFFGLPVLLRWEIQIWSLSRLSPGMQDFSGLHCPGLPLKLIILRSM